MLHKILYLPVPHVTRDLASRLMLCREAAMSGWITVLLKQSWFLRNIDNLSPGVVFLGTSPSIIDDVKMIKSKGFYYIAECSEAGMWNRRRYLSYKAAPSNLALADLYLAWGQRHAEIVRERCDRLPILVSGSPRMELSISAHDIFSNEIEKLRELYGRYILIVSNGRHQYSRFGRINVERMAVDLANRFPGISLGEYRKIINEFMANGSVFWNAAKLVAKECPETKIVYRPRFGDDVSRIRDEFSRADNVTVVEEGPINPLIAASQGVVHQSCTSGLEAVLMKKPNIDFVPSQISYPFEIADRTFKKAKSISEIKAFIEAILGGYNVEKYMVTQSAVEPYIANVGHRDSSSAVIMQRLNKDLADLPTLNKSLSDKLLPSRKFHQRCFDVSTTIKRIIRRPVERGLKMGPSYSEPLDIDSIKKYALLLGLEHDLSISEVSPGGAYVLQSKPN